MNRISTLLASALILANATAFAADEAKPADAAAAQVKTYKSPKLNRAQLDALLAKPEQLLIIDIRRPDELTKIGGLPVYLSIQFQDLEKSIAYIPKDRTIVTVSNHAGRAFPAADLLLSKGFKVAGAVGVQNYEEEGGTLVKIVPPPPKVAEASPAAK